MAITAASTICSEDIALNRGDPDFNEVMGKLTADYLPGVPVVYVVATQTWTAADSDVANDLLMEGGIVGYRKRVNQSTGALITIDTAWDADGATNGLGDTNVPIITSGICIAKITDQNAARGAGTRLIPSSTIGELTIQTVASADAFATLAADVADDDTYAVVGIGKCKGRRHAFAN